MANKQYEMLFKLNAQANSGFKGTFSQAQAEFARLGNEIQSLNKIQGDISAYQKQEAAISRTKAKLAELEGKYAEVEQAIKEHGGETEALARKKAGLDEQLRKTNTRLEDQQARLSAAGDRLQEAKVGTIGLSSESKRLSERIAELSKEQEQAAQTAQSYRDRAVDAFQAAGEALAAAGIVAGIKELGAAYVGTVQAAGEFGAAMSNVEALSGASAGEMAALNAQAKELGATTKFTAMESGEAMGYMGMAGWNARQMLAGMPGVLDLAAASGEDLAGVSDIVTDSLTGFGMTAADTGRFVDVLAMASSKSNTNVSMLGESFKYAAPLCGTLGYTAEDAAVMLGLMANSGIKASQAGTTLRTALSNMIAPTKDQAAEMDRLGLSLTDTNGQMLPLLDMVGNLRGAFSGMSEAEQSAAASALFGKEAMSGMLAIINASEADYQSLAQSIENSAGAAERMAQIKLDNLAGDLTLLDSAADGLSLTIGEEFMPQIRGLVQAGTGVISFIDALVQEHPALTKVLMGTVGAIGAVTAGVVAFSAAKKAAAVIDLAAMFSTAGPILAVAGALGAVAAGVISWVEAANEGIPKVEELTEAAQKSAEAMEQVSTDFDASRVNIEATAVVAGDYIDRLEELEAKTSRTNAESTEYHNILQLLCETVPELAGSIDLTTDSIEGGTEALRAQTEAWEKNAQAQAYQEAYQNLLSEYNGVMVEAAENSLRLTEAESKLNRDMEERAQLLDEIAALEADGGWRTNQDKADYFYGLGQRVNVLNEEIRKGEKTVKNYQEAVETDSAAVEEAEAATEGYRQAMEDLLPPMEDSSAAAGGMVDQNRELWASMEEVGAQAEALRDAYDEAYGAALSSVQGQYALWDEAAEVAAVSTGDINAALESQVSYWQNYNSNLALLRDRAGDVQGLSDVIASFADGSSESVNAVAGMASATDQELADMVQSWQKLQREHDTTSDSIAEFVTDFTGKMDELGQALQEDVEGMDYSAEAGEAARKTIDAYIQVAEDMLPRVRTAYGRLRAAGTEGMTAARAGTLPNGMRTALSLSGYATGTQDAEPGFALVGENGPELVFFEGGEQVMNAAETAALQRQSAVSAIPAGGYGGEPVVVQIYFQFAGNPSPETVDRLREYGDEFEARVRRVMEDYYLESARRRYS